MVFHMYSSGPISAQVVLQIFLASVKSVGTAAVLALPGVILARKGVISRDVSRGLSQVSMQITIPCLLFSSVVPNVSVSVLRECWPLLVLPFLFVPAGLVIGSLVVLICQPGASFRKGTVAAVAFGNSTGIPIVLLSVVHAALKGPADVDPMLFLSVYLIFYPALQWAVGGWLLGVGRKPHAAHGEPGSPIAAPPHPVAIAVTGPAADKAASPAAAVRARAVTAGDIGNNGGGGGRSRKEREQAGGTRVARQRLDLPLRSIVGCGSRGALPSAFAAAQPLQQMPLPLGGCAPTAFLPLASACSQPSHGTLSLSSSRSRSPSNSARTADGSGTATPSRTPTRRPLLSAAPGAADQVQQPAQQAQQGVAGTSLLGVPPPACCAMPRTSSRSRGGSTGSGLDDGSTDNGSIASGSGRASHFGNGMGAANGPVAGSSGDRSPASRNGLGYGSAAYGDACAGSKSVESSLSEMMPNLYGLADGERFMLDADADDDDDYEDEDEGEGEAGEGRGAGGRPAGPFGGLRAFSPFRAFADIHDEQEDEVDRHMLGAAGGGRPGKRAAAAIAHLMPASARGAWGGGPPRAQAGTGGARMEAGCATAAESGSELTQPMLQRSRHSSGFLHGQHAHARGCRARARRFAHKAKHLLKQIFKPAVIAVACGICVGLAPPLKALLVPEHSAPFGWMFTGIARIGGAAVPINLMLLGATLSKGPSWAHINMKTNIGIVVAKMVISPIVGSGARRARLCTGPRRARLAAAVRRALLLAELARLPLLRAVHSERHQLGSSRAQARQLLQSGRFMSSLGFITPRPRPHHARAPHDGMPRGLQVS